MLASSLISLPAETLRQLAENESAHPQGSGSAGERRVGLVVVIGVIALATLFGLMPG